MSSIQSTERFAKLGTTSDANLNDPLIRTKILEKFCKAFGFDTSKVPDQIISALIELKCQRDTIVHELEHASKFELFFQFVMAIACCIYFCWSGAKNELNIYPWEDLIFSAFPVDNIHDRAQLVVERHRVSGHYKWDRIIVCPSS